MVKLGFIVLGALLGISGIACSSGDSGGAVTSPPGIASSSPAASSATVDMNDQLKFVPETITVAVGATVTWINVGKVSPHTVTAAHNEFSSGGIDPGKSFKNTFNTAGTFAYFCKIHSNMKGTVTVA
jgi:plastocyanin